jgi:hypothetical protein
MADAAFQIVSNIGMLRILVVAMGRWPTRLSTYYELCLVSNITSVGMGENKMAIGMSVKITTVYSFESFPARSHNDLDSITTSFIFIEMVKSKLIIKTLNLA